MIVSNYHTHTTFCDGKNTPKEMVEYAIKKGFSHLGFSAHSLYPFAADWHLPTKNFQLYITEIKKLAETYKDLIEIYTGFEADYLPPFSVPNKELYQSLGADYLIGSTHYIYSRDDISVLNKTTGIGLSKSFFTVDGPVEEVMNGIKNLFNGDGKKACQTYFATQREMIKYCNFDIVGHIDLIRKRNGILHFFDESESWYKNELQETAKIISQSNVVVELNTGGIARGAIDDIYPSSEFLKILKNYDVQIMLNSDAHSGNDLDCAFERAKKIALDAGFTNLVYFSKGTWKSTTIKL